MGCTGQLFSAEAWLDTYASPFLVSVPPAPVDSATDPMDWGFGMPRDWGCGMPRAPAACQAAPPSAAALAAAVLASRRSGPAIRGQMMV